MTDKQTNLQPFASNHTSRRRLRHLYQVLVLISVLLCNLAAPLLRAQEPEAHYVLDSTLRLLRAMRETGNAPPRLHDLLQSPKIGVSIRFRQGFRQPSLLQMEKQLGLEFTQVNSKVARVGTIYSAQVPWDSLQQLARWPGVERVDSTWKPAVAPALDVSIPEIRADQVWNLLDASGWPLTGRGVVIANFDTGVDVFHPDLWRADGGTYPWLDVNSNGVFDAGIDAIDLNRNGFAEATERLRILDSTSSMTDNVPGTNDSAFQAATDWLYNDANNNGQRDWGPTSGFAEANPTYGERLFLLNDSNQNDTVDIGEVLLALGTCKVQKVLGPHGLEYARGINLINSPADETGHGTLVCSILSGGSPGRRRYVGVAPEARLLVANWKGNAYTTYITWAEENGAQVMLYEFGSWIQEFMDGSSNLERMLDSEAAKGIIQVVPAGNLAEGNKHAHLILGGASPGNIGNVRFAVPLGLELKEASLSILWPAPLDAVGVELITPSGTTVPLPGNDSVMLVDGHYIYSARDRSTSTSRFDIWINRSGANLTPGNWSLQLRNYTSSWVNVHAYVADDMYEWEGGITFLDYVDTMYTVTSPATANSAITVASYSTRARAGTTPSGALSPFSSKGPRIDGEWIMDLSAPGHYSDIACASSKDALGATFGQYAWFGGTCAAAAHVAGAVALLLQKSPSLSSTQMMQLLRTTARQDAHTGITPNESWGYGKLDAWAALRAIPTPTPIPTPTLTPTITPTPRARMFLPIIMRGF